MSDVRRVFAEREAKRARLCREAFQVAEREASYRTNVLARLSPELGQPDDLWAAIPWIWTATLGGALPETGALTAAVERASVILRGWLAGDEPVDVLRSRWNESVGDDLALGSTLRSHPFADLRSWSIRPQFAAS